jgi:hypothetical protein
VKLKFASVVIANVLTTWIIAKPGLYLFVNMCLSTLCPFVSKGITASVVTGSSTMLISAGSLINHSRAHKVNFCLIFTS